MRFINMFEILRVGLFVLGFVIFHGCKPNLKIEVSEGSEPLEDEIVSFDSESLDIQGATTYNAAVSGYSIGVNSDIAIDFQYGIVIGGDCSSVEYSDWIDSDTPIDIRLTGEAELTLCVQGRDANGNVQKRPTTFTWQDSDGDGVDDDSDAFPNDAAEIADSDGDGVGDNRDTFPNSNIEFNNLPFAYGESLTTGLGYGNNNDVYADGSNVYVATNGVGLSISRDGGSTWTTVSGSNGMGSNDVYEIDGDGSNLCAASNGGIAISTDSGNTWAVKTTAHQLAHNQVLSCLVEGSTIYAGTKEGLSVSTDLGTTWTSFTTADGLGANQINSVFAQGPNIYVGTQGGGFSMSNDGGSTWTTKNLSNGVRDIVYKVHVDSGVIYLATDGLLYFSSDAGATWTSVGKTELGYTQMHYHAHSVFADGDNIFLVVLHKGLFVSNDSGVTWSNTRNASSGWNTSDFHVDGTKVYLALVSKGLGTSNDFGVTFTYQTSSHTFTSTNFTGVYATGNHIFATASSSSGLQGGLYVSHDLGQTWSREVSWMGHTDTFDVTGYGGKIYVSNRGGLGISDDYGASFSNLTTTNGLAGNVVRDVKIDNDKIYAATNGGLSISADSGVTWSNITTSEGLISNDNRAVYVSGSSIYVATPSGISISNNSGTSWTNYTTADTGLPSNWSQDIYATGTNIYVATNGGLWISNNSGATWTNKTTADGLGSDMPLCVEGSGSTIYVCNSDRGGLSISHDYGATWMNKNSVDGLGSGTVTNVYTDGQNLYVSESSSLGVSYHQLSP